MGFLTRLKRDWWLFLLGGLIPGSVIFAWLLSIITENTFTEWVSIIGIIGPMIMTLVLAFLYQGLKNIQSDQTEIMRYNQEPKISLDRIDVVDYGPTWGPPQFVIYLSNVGKGAAEDLEATISAEPIGGTDLDIKFGNKKCKLTRYGPERESNEEYTTIKEEGDSFVQMS